MFGDSIFLINISHPCIILFPFESLMQVCGGLLRYWLADHNAVTHGKNAMRNGITGGQPVTHLIFAKLHPGKVNASVFSCLWRSLNTS